MFFLQFLIILEDESNFVCLMFLDLIDLIRRVSRFGLLKDQKSFEKKIQL